MAQRLQSRDALVRSYREWLTNGLGRGLYSYLYQDEFCEELYGALMTREYNEIGYEVSRQAGKTTGVAEPVAFLCGIADILFCVGSRPFGIGFFAPREDQYMTDWIRIRDILPDVCGVFGLVVMIENEKIIRLGRKKFNRQGQCIKTVPRIELHGYSLGEGTKVESKTLDVAIIEEAQDIDDVKVDKMVRPMLTSTDGVIAHVGVAGYKKCYFKKLTDSKKHCIIWPYDKVIETRRDAFEKTGNQYHLNYEAFIVKELERIGNQITDEFRTQYKLEWITEVGNFITSEQLILLKRDVIKPRSRYVRVGIDFAKAHDFTVVTICTELGQRLASLRMNGTDYTQQIPLLLEWIEKWCQDNPFEYTSHTGETLKTPMEVEYLQYDHTGVGNAVGEMLDQKSRWVVRAVDFTARVIADMFQDLLNLIAMGIGLAKGAVEDTGQRRFEYLGTDQNVEVFEFEATDAEKSYQGQLGILSVHAPDKKDKHDDTLFSLILATYEGEVVPSLGVTSV